MTSTRCPRARHARARPVTTSPRPPTLAIGAISAVMCTTCRLRASFFWAAVEPAAPSKRLSGASRGGRSQKAGSVAGSGHLMPRSTSSSSGAASSKGGAGLLLWVSSSSSSGAKLTCSGGTPCSLDSSRRSALFSAASSSACRAASVVLAAAGRTCVWHQSKVGGSCKASILGREQEGAPHQGMPPSAADDQKARGWMGRSSEPHAGARHLR
jgi:hypothetical protein